MQSHTPSLNQPQEAFTRMLLIIRASNSCIMLDYVRVINFRIIIIIIICFFLFFPRVYNARGIKTERIKTAEMTRGPKCHQGSHCVKAPNYYYYYYYYYYCPTEDRKLS